MILWCDGAHAPAENMRRDRVLLDAATAAVREGRPREAVLRLFAWEPHGITLGYAQRAEAVLDPERCDADGVPWTIRPTGGRAIFHADEWTYSLTAAVEDPDWGGSLADAYARASSLLLASLQRLGVPAEHAGAPRGRAGRHGAACFASTGRHEIVLDGRKLVGSAQRRSGGALLQQGSVLLGAGHLRLADYLALSEAERARSRQELDVSAGGAREHVGSRGLAEWADAITAVTGGVRRVDGAMGGFLLTMPEAPTYTPAASQPEWGQRVGGL